MPHYNSDGYGSHLYVPWWLSDKHDGLNFPRGYHVELGGGYSASDLEAYFGGLGIPVPSVTAASVDGASNAPGSGNQSRWQMTLPQDPPPTAPLTPGKSFNFQLHPAFWLNKVLATPPWCLLSSALTAACWAVIFVLTDVKGWRRWPKAVSIAGENALLCYLMAPFLLSLFALSAPLFGGNNFYEKLGESTVIGFVRSTVFAWVVVRLSGRLRGPSTGTPWSAARAGSGTPRGAARSPPPRRRP